MQPPGNVKVSKTTARSSEVTRGVCMINAVCWLSQMLKAAPCQGPRVWVGCTQLVADTADVPAVYISAFTIRGRGAVKSWLSWDKEERGWKWDTLRYWSILSAKQHLAFRGERKKDEKYPSSRFLLWVCYRTGIQGEKISVKTAWMKESLCRRLWLGNYRNVCDVI